MRQWRACRQNPWQPIAGLQTLCGGFKQRARISRSGPLRNNDLSSMDFFFSRGSFIMDNEKIFVPAAHTHLQTKENRFPHAMKESKKNFASAALWTPRKNFAPAALLQTGENCFPYAVNDNEKNFVHAALSQTKENRYFLME